MTNAEKFQLAFNHYATEIWALPEEEFLKWLNEEHEEVRTDGIGATKKFRCNKCGLVYYTTLFSAHHDDFYNFDYWVADCPLCGEENEVNNCYWR